MNASAIIALLMQLYPLVLQLTNDLAAALKRIQALEATVQVLVGTNAGGRLGYLENSVIPALQSGGSGGLTIVSPVASMTHTLVSQSPDGTYAFSGVPVQVFCEGVQMSEGVHYELLADASGNKVGIHPLKARGACDWSSGDEVQIWQ